MKIPNFLGAAYASRSLPLSAQTLVNLFYEGAPPGGPEDGMFYGSPGLKLYATLGTGPIRGAHQAKGYGWVVSGSALYRVTGGAGTLVGTIPGTGRVCMQDNDTQLAVMHNLGWESVTFSTLSVGSVPGAPTTAQGTFQDSYVVFPLANGTYGWTAIDNLQSIDPLSFASSEAQPDPVVSILSDSRELWLFNSQTTQVAQTSGDADLVFTITATMEYGCTAKYSPAKSNNTVYWLGQNDSGNNIIYMAQGYAPARISTHALEDAMRGYGDTSDAWGYCYQQNGHTFYVITFPGRATWAFDASSQRWTQLAHRDTVTGAQGPHKANAYMFVGGQHIVGDTANGNLYTLDLDTFTDNGDPIERERAFAAIENENKWMRHDRVEIIGEMGVGLDGVNPPTPGANPTWALDWSDDGGRRWGSARLLTIGKIGENRVRAFTRRLGLSRRRVYRLRTAAPVKLCLYGANIDFKGLSK